LLVLVAVMGSGRVRERLARAADVVPLTARGALFAPACAAALQFASAEADRMVAMLASAGLALLALSALAVVIGALRVRAVLARGPDPARRLSLEVGRDAPGGLRLPRLRALLLVDVRSDWVGPEQVRCSMRPRGGSAEEWIRPDRRFELSRVVRRIRVSDAFGLARVSWLWGRSQHVTALPPTGMPHGETPASRSAGDDAPSAAGAAQGDRFDLRPYQPGEPARHILWRSWARSGQLFTRAPERSAAPARRVAAYLVCGPGDEAAAGAARAALECGALGMDWLFGADGCDTTARTVGDALSLIARSGNAAPAPGIGRFAALLESEPQAALLVFAPAEPGAWLEELERALGGRSGESAIVLVHDRQRRMRPPWLAWRRTRDRDPLETVRERLAERAHMAVVERSAGAWAARDAVAQLERCA
jgi:hypothetical protein